MSDVNDKRVKGFRLNVDLISAIETAAGIEGQNLSEYAKRAFIYYLNRDKPLATPQHPPPLDTGIPKIDDGPFEPDVMPPMPDEQPPWEEEKPTIKRIGGSDSAKKFYTTR